MRLHVSRMGSVESSKLPSRCVAFEEAGSPDLNKQPLIRQIASHLPDLHSGVEGGAWNEPMMDM